jgi:hypothetical protein
VYRLKQEGQPAGEPMRLQAATAYFNDKLAEPLVLTTRRATLPARIGLGIEDDALRTAVRGLWEREVRFPLTVSFALRAAFRHMRLHVFRTPQGVHFVTPIPPTPLDPAHTVEGIHRILAFLQEHPGSGREDLAAALCPGLAADAPEVKAALAPLGWLIDKGHIIEFWNGMLGTPHGMRACHPEADGGNRGKADAQGT